ncbi:MAG: presqualene diphosphate synthase HpnD [Planctomycetes bacterium]|nr:presqualene diphosphate synthase HpnD [Planctomycetota bacterium]
MSNLNSPIPTVLDLEAAHDHCRRVTQAAAKNFYYAFALFPEAERRAMCAVYAFARMADDLADEPGEPAAKAAALADLRARLERSGREPSTDPVLAALADARVRFHLPLAPLEDLLRGVEMDLSVRRYAGFDDLRLYCYRVASTVGLVTIEIFGYQDPAARAHAEDLGIAMQLTNILRDVREDLERDRVYLPQDELARFGVTEADLAAGRATPAFHELMAFQARRAREYFVRGERILPFVRKETRYCPAILQTIYRRLLLQIQARPERVLRERVRLSTTEKLFWMFWLWLRHRVAGA